MQGFLKAKDELIEELKTCSVYQTFLEKSAELDKDPEKWKLVNEIRRENYEFYKFGSPGGYDQRMEELSTRMESLRADQTIDEFFAAELALCRPVQNLVLELMENIEFNVDFL